MEDHSNDLAELLSAAKKEVFNKNFPHAVDILEQVIESYPQSVEGYNLLAYAVKMSLGNTMDAQQKSLELMEKALEINPNNTLTLFNMASTYYEMEEFAKAINYYQLLVNSNRINDYRVYFNLAMCYEKLKDNLKATENYQQALKLNPDFSSAVINYSNLLMSMGKQTQAKYVLEHYLKNNRNDDRAQNNLNIILAERQIDPKVEENFKKISQNGGITSVYNNGVFLSKQQKYGEALNIFKSLVERLHNQFDEPLLLLSHVNQGVLYEKMNNFEMAIQKYNYIIDNFSNQINIEEFQNRIAEVRARDRERARLNFIPKLTNNQGAMSKTGMNFNNNPQSYQQMSAKPSHKQPLASLVSKNNFINGTSSTQQKVKSPEKKVDEYQIAKPPQQQQTLQPLQKPKSSFVRKGSRDQMVAQSDEYQMMGPKQDSVYQHDGMMAQSMLEQQQVSALGKVGRRPSTGRHNKIVNQKSSESDPQERQPQQAPERSHSGRSWIEEQKPGIKHDTPSFVQETKQNQRYERPVSSKMENEQINRVRTEAHDENQAYSFTQNEQEEGQQQYLNPQKKQQRDVPPPSVNSAVKSRESIREKSESIPQQSVEPSNFQSRVTKDSPKGSEAYRSHLPDADTPRSQVFEPDNDEQSAAPKEAIPSQKQIKPSSAHRIVSAESKRSKQQVQQASAKPDRPPSGRSAVSNQQKQEKPNAARPSETKLDSQGQIVERRVSSRVQSARSLKSRQGSDAGSQRVIESRQEPTNLLDSQHDDKREIMVEGNDYEDDHEGEADADEIEPNNPMEDTFHGREVKSQVDDNYEDDQQEMYLEQGQYIEGINREPNQDFKQEEEGDDIANPLDSDRPRSDQNQSPLLQVPQRDVPEIIVQHTEDHRHLELKRSDYENLDDTQINNPLLNDDDDQNPVLNQAESKMMSIQGSQHVQHSVNTSNILLDGELKQQLKARKVDEDRSEVGENILDKIQFGDNTPQQTKKQVLSFPASPQLEKKRQDHNKSLDQQDHIREQDSENIFDPSQQQETNPMDDKSQLQDRNPFEEDPMTEEQQEEQPRQLLEGEDKDKLEARMSEEAEQQQVIDQGESQVRPDDEQQNNDPPIEHEPKQDDQDKVQVVVDDGQKQDENENQQNDQGLQDQQQVEQGEQTEQRDDEKNAQRNQQIEQNQQIADPIDQEQGVNQQGQQTEPQVEEQPANDQESQRQQEANQVFEQGDQGDQSHRIDDEAQQQSQIPVDEEQQRNSNEQAEPAQDNQDQVLENQGQMDDIQQPDENQSQNQGDQIDQNNQNDNAEPQIENQEQEEQKQQESNQDPNRDEGPQEQDEQNQIEQDQVQDDQVQAREVEQVNDQPEQQEQQIDQKVDIQENEAENPEQVQVQNEVMDDQQAENPDAQNEQAELQNEAIDQQAENPDPQVEQVEQQNEVVENPELQNENQEQQQNENPDQEQIDDPDRKQGDNDEQQDENPEKQPDQEADIEPGEDQGENPQNSTEDNPAQPEPVDPEQQVEEQPEQITQEAQVTQEEANEQQQEQQQENQEEQPSEQNPPNDVANPLEEEAHKNDAPQDGYEDTRTEETKSVKKRRKQRQYVQYPEGFGEWTLEMCKQMIEEDPTNIFPYFKLAIIYIELSEIKEAKTYLLQVHQMNAEFEAEKVNWGLGEVFESEKDWESALQHFKNVYPYTSEKQDCLLKIARCQSKLKHYDHAVRAYQKAVDINNKNYYPYYKLGWMQVKNNDLKFGIDNLLKASCLDTQNVDILIKLGEGYLLYEEEESSVDDAIETLMKGLLIDPQNYDCTISLAKAFEKKQDLDKAIEYAKQATVQANSNINSYFYLGTLYMKKKELKLASDAFRTLLIEHNSEHVDALIEYATILSLQGSHDKAKKYFRHALKFDPNNTTANLRLGKIFQTKLKDLTAAIECFTKIVKVDPQNYKAHYYIGICYMEKQDYKNATECMKESLKLNSRFNLAWKAIGNILYETNSPSKALKYFQRSLECDPTDLEAKIGLANCHYLLEDFESAINLYEEISHIDHNEELEYNLANCHYMRNDYDSAIIHYQKALQMNPKKTECYYNLGNAFCIQERFQEALECFENSIRHDPKHYSALYNLANTYYVLNDYENAARFFEEAIELQPDNLEWRNYVASLYLEKNDLPEAKRHIDESLRISSTHPDTYVKLSTYYSQLGNLKEAVSNAKYALSLSPDNEEAQQLLVELER